MEGVGVETDVGVLPTTETEAKLTKVSEAVASQVRQQLGIRQTAETIAVCVPVMDNVAARWVVPFIEMCFDIVNAGYRIAIFTDNAKPLQRCRNRLLQWAMNDGADWILWVDSDNTPPKNGWRKLMKYNLPIVSGLYFTRTPPYKPTAMMINDHETYDFLIEYPKNALIKCDATGLGFTLMKREVFDKLQKDPFTWARYSEDIQFFRDAKEKGFDCWVDTGMIVEHLGGVVDEACFEGHKADFIKDMKLKQVELNTLEPMSEPGT